MPWLHVCPMEVLRVRVGVVMVPKVPDMRSTWMLSGSTAPR
jgi:hypothetical protein